MCGLAKTGICKGAWSRSCYCCKAFARQTCSTDTSVCQTHSVTLYLTGLQSACLQTRQSCCQSWLCRSCINGLDESATCPHVYPYCLLDIIFLFLLHDAMSSFCFYCMRRCHHERKYLGSRLQLGNDSCQIHLPFVDSRWQRRGAKQTGWPK